MDNQYTYSMISRVQDTERVRKLLGIFPIVATLGPRQSGKTTLAGEFRADHYFDLEHPRDRLLYDAPQTVLEAPPGRHS